MPIFAIIAIVALIGGGTSAAAEGALPGDALYSIKVSFNEKVVEVLSFSADAKAQWEARLAERRIEEAEKLASKGVEIDDDERDTLEARFETHADRVEARIEDLKDTDARAAADLASRFETSLKVHESILARISASSTGSGVGSLRVKVGSALQNVSGMRAEAEARVSADGNGPDVKAAAEGKIGAAENVIASSRNYIENKKATLGADAAASAEAKLKVAEDAVVQAKAKVSAGAYGEAFNLAQSAIRTAQEAKGLIESGLRLDAHATSTVFIGGWERDHENETSTEARERDRNATSGLRVRGEVDVKVGY